MKKLLLYILICTSLCAMDNGLQKEIRALSGKLTRLNTMLKQIPSKKQPSTKSPYPVYIITENGSSLASDVWGDRLMIIMKQIRNQLEDRQVFIKYCETEFWLNEPCPPSDTAFIVVRMDTVRIGEIQDFVAQNLGNNIDISKYSRIILIEMLEQNMFGTESSQEKLIFLKEVQFFEPRVEEIFFFVIDKRQSELSSGEWNIDELNRFANFLTQPSTPPFRPARQTQRQQQERLRRERLKIQRIHIPYVYYPLTATTLEYLTSTINKQLNPNTFLTFDQGTFDDIAVILLSINPIDATNINQTIENVIQQYPDLKTTYRKKVLVIDSSNIPDSQKETLRQLIFYNAKPQLGIIDMVSFTDEVPHLVRFLNNFAAQKRAA